LAFRGGHPIRQSRRVVFSFSPAANSAMPSTCI
jgi:hypothetical protein